MKKITIESKSNEEKIVPFVWIDGEEADVTFESVLKNEGSSVHIVGLFFGTDNHAVKFNTLVVHQAKNTKSRTTIRGVFLNNSSFTSDGLIRILSGAKNADGYFDSKILLFDDAKGRSVPSLEIDENELKAGHASTVGRLDSEQLFYLQSRGLSQEAAEKLLVIGFFEPILTFFPLSKQRIIRQRVEKIV